MRKLGKWGIAATFVCCGLLFLACANNDNNVPDTSVLNLWQAGKTVTTETVTAYGGIDKCFAAEPLPRYIATARGTSHIRLITKTSASASLLRQVLSGVVTGLRVKTTNTLNLLNKNSRRAKMIL